MPLPLSTDEPGSLGLEKFDYPPGNFYDISQPASTFESMIFPTSPNKIPSGPLEGIFISPPQKKDSYLLFSTPLKNISQHGNLPPIGIKITTLWNHHPGMCWFSWKVFVIPPPKKKDSHVDVSKNSGTPKSSILIGFSIINHPFWGTPNFRKHPYFSRATQLPSGVLHSAFFMSHVFIAFLMYLMYECWRRQWLCIGHE